MSNALHPVFDPNGKYLYFTASTDNGPSDAGIDLSSLDRTINAGVYVVVLARNGASPIAPESDDENKKKDEDAKKADKSDEETDQASDGDKADAKKGEKKDGKKDEKKKADAKPKPTVIDLADIGNRILSLPIPSRNYVELAVGKTGVLFLAEGPPVGRSAEDRRIADPRTVAFHHGEASDRRDLERADELQRLLRRREIVLSAATTIGFSRRLRN